MDDLQKRLRAIRRWKIDKKYKPPPPNISVNYEEFTEEQKEIVETVKRQLQRPKEQRYGEPLHMIIQGEGGTGKTVLLIYLSKLLREKLTKEKCIVASFTGVSAHNFGATTIHSAFKIKPFAAYEDLLKNLDQNSKLLGDLSQVEFILLDEFSFIGLQLFGYLDLLMRRARPFYSQIAFGGTSVILCGDIFQV